MTDTPRPGTRHPHLARERALKVLFAADVRGVDPRELLDEVETNPADLELLDELEPDQDQVADDDQLQLELTRRSRLPIDDYTRLLVRGVAARRPAIDRLLGDVADRWAVQRMPVVDRNLLRLAIYELAEQDTPHPVVIDEAVSLAGAFAGEKARSFVNGVLETVRQQVVAGEVELEVAEEVAASDAAAPVAAEAPVDGPGPAPDGAEEAADDVDEAAQEAYDLALDLLDEPGVDPEQFDAPAPEDDTRVLDEDTPGEDLDDGADGDLEVADEDNGLRDQDDALW